MRLAQMMTNLISSWLFISFQTIFLLVYVAYNLSSGAVFDAYPFVFLNLLLSFQAAYTAPIILMAHKELAERDKLAALQDKKAVQKIIAYIKKIEKIIEEDDDL